MQYTDCHMHLCDNRIAACRDEILNQAFVRGVKTLLLNAAEQTQWPLVMEIGMEMSEHIRHIKIIPFIGLHPWFVDSADAQWRDKLTEIVASTRCGVGECGLDHKRREIDHNAQAEAFVWQLKLAEKYSRSVCVHCVGAWEALLDILKSTKLPPAVQLHAFGGSSEIAAKFFDMDVYFSFAGNIANPKRKKAHRVLKAIPQDKLLCESDCPDLSWSGGDSKSAPDIIHDCNGRRISQPADIPETIAAIARIRGENPRELAEIIQQNARRFIATLI